MLQAGTEKRALAEQKSKGFAESACKSGRD
jgi:hypothetical protein